MIIQNVDYAEYLLRKGEVVAIPTETVYGLAANAFNEQAVTKIFEIKKRPFFNPLIIHLKSVKDLSKVTQKVPQVAKDLAQAFWPGPLTLILPKKPIISDLVTGGKNTVAVRVPNHPKALRLLGQLNFPLAAPSANPFGTISPTCAQHVVDYFGDTLEFVLDGGACENGIESTIVGFENEQPIIYRLGAIKIEEIEKIVGKVTIKNHDSENPTAPGMLLKHYAPKSNMVLSDNVTETMAEFQGKKIAVLLTKTDIKANSNHIVIEKICNNEDYETAAKNLYAALRKLDTENAEVIIAEKCSPVGLGLSINDRLYRASQK